MIDLSFWKNVKTLWIRDEDPTIKATERFIQKDTKSTEDINELNRKLNGENADSDDTGSIDEINRMMEQLDELGVDNISFDSFFDDDE